MGKRRALITGITGQDGSYLAEFLLQKGYEVHGLRRPNSANILTNIGHLPLDDPDNAQAIWLHYGDLTDSSCLNRLIEKIEPHEIYNLAAQSHVHISFQIPEYTAEVNALGALRLLDAIRETKVDTRLYQASTSELFGAAAEVPQSEGTRFAPRSPYAASKLFAFHATVNYREAYGIFAVNGILFNHESPRRGPSFVTRKISTAIARILHGSGAPLVLGNLDARRDWGFAPEYVEAMWMMLQHTTPEDFVIATGETHTVREFVELAFREVDVEIAWQGKGIHEVGVDTRTGRTLVAIDPYYFRPTEVDLLQGDASKAEAHLGWKPAVRFEELVRLMVRADVEAHSSRPAHR